MKDRLELNLVILLFIAAFILVECIESAVSCMPL